MFDVLGYGANVCTNGYEIMITFPAGNQMEMEMFGYTGAGGLSQVEANVDAMGIESPAQDGAADGKHFHKASGFVSAQFGEIAEMPSGGEE